MHDPVKIGFPPNVAIVDVVGSWMPGSMLATVIDLDPPEVPVIDDPEAMTLATEFA